MITKEELLEVISGELEERTAQQSENTDCDISAELKALQELHETVRLEGQLDFSMYSWLCDLVECYSFIRGEENAKSE